MTEEQMREKILQNREKIKQEKQNLQKAIEEEDDDKISDIENNLIELWTKLKLMKEELDELKGVWDGNNRKTKKDNKELDEVIDRLCDSKIEVTRSEIIRSLSRIQASTKHELEILEIDINSLNEKIKILKGEKIWETEQ